MEPGLVSADTSANLSKVSPATSPSDKDPHLLDADEASKSRMGSIDSQQSNKDDQLASDGSALESLPTQLIDLAGETPAHDPNRIPPHVFARTKSTAPVEWSVASNESLFSIHMGNMSFTAEQLNWMTKSGEFPLTGDGPLSGDIPYSPSPPLPPVGKSPDSGVQCRKSDNLNQVLGATEAASAETMREVIRENANDHNDQEKLPLPKADTPKKANPRAMSSKRSDDSSIKSFAFPILTGDGNCSRSMSINQEKKNTQQAPPSTPKTAAEPETPKPKSEPEAPTQQTPKATTKAAGPAKWFSCFSCCPFCS